MLYTIVYKLFDLVKVGRKPPLMDMVLSIYFQKTWAVPLSPMMSIYFRTYRENGTPKPFKSWAVLGYPVIPTEKSGQRGRCKVTNNTVGNKQIEANMCVSENFYQSYFGPIKDMFFSADVIYEQNICPYIFLNTLPLVLRPVPSTAPK